MTEREILFTLENRGYLILYTTPESLSKLRWLDPLIRTLVVDECHCVTMWGYTFRKAYLAIGLTLRLLSHRPVVIAMTATAPPEIRQEIEQLLDMERVCRFQVPLHRKNLTFVIRPAASKKQREKALKKLLDKHQGESVILYCSTQAMTDRVYECVLLYRDSDYQNNLRILEQSDTTEQGREALDAMKEIADSSACIVRQVLEFLGEEGASDCGKCSSCQRKRRKKA